MNTKYKQYNNYGAKLTSHEYDAIDVYTEMYRIFLLSMNEKPAGIFQHEEIQHNFEVLLKNDLTISSNASLAETVPWIFGFASHDRVNNVAEYLQDGLEEDLSVPEFRERISSAPCGLLHRKIALPKGLRYKKTEPKLEKTIEDIKQNAFSKIKNI